MRTGPQPQIYVSEARMSGETSKAGKIGQKARLSIGCIHGGVGQGVTSVGSREPILAYVL